MLAVSIDDLADSAYAVKQLGLDFPVLYDESGDVVRSFGVFNQATGYANPSTFIIDTSGAIAWEHIGSTSHRTPERVIIEQLQQLN